MKLDKNTIIIMILEAIIFIGIIVFMSNYSGRKVETLDQNLIAARDRITELTLENGNLLSSKSAYILKNQQLEEVLEITKNQKKEIEKRLDDKIAYIAKIESQVKIDTIEVHDTVIIKDSSTVNIKFDYDDQWLKFSGETYYKNGKSKTQLFDITIPTPLKVGLTDDYTIFVESANPYLNITDIEGAIIDGSSLRPKRKAWNFSIHAGIGVHYGLFGQQVDVGPYVGAGISYNF